MTRRQWAATSRLRSYHFLSILNRRILRGSKVPNQVAPGKLESSTSALLHPCLNIRNLKSFSLIHLPDSWHLPTTTHFCDLFIHDSTHLQAKKIASERFFSKGYSLIREDDREEVEALTPFWHFDSRVIIFGLR